MKLIRIEEWMNGTDLIVEDLTEEDYQEIIEDSKYALEVLKKDNVTLIIKEGGRDLIIE